MINWLIDVALRNRFIVVALYLGLAGWGWWALTTTPIDANPRAQAGRQATLG